MRLCSLRPAVSITKRKNSKNVSRADAKPPLDRAWRVIRRTILPAKCQPQRDTGRAPIIRILPA